MTHARFRAPLIALGLAASAAPAAPAAADGLCQDWSEPQAVALLDTDMIGEESGLEISARFAGRLYQNNDSGDGPYFYVTDLAGGATRRVTISGFRPRDVEDIALGPCGQETCIVLADIGDNERRRRRVQIVLVAEADFGEEAAPRAIVSASYPDGPHNAEAAAMHPDGDLYVLTKSGEERRATRPAGLYRLTAAQLEAGGEQSFEHVAEIDLPAMTGGEDHYGRVATAMDISADGSRVLVLTYRSMVEIAADLSRLSADDPAGWARDRDYRVTPIATLPQAEAIAYSADGRAVLYGTESVARAPAPLILQTCTD